MLTFAGIDLSMEAVPDATTLLNSLHLLEAHDLTWAIFAEVAEMLSERKLLMNEGSIVDATIIAAPSSTKNARKERDPQMHQTRKGNQSYFGMKAHIGVDAQSGLVHSVSGTGANVADVTQSHALLHGEEKEACADAGYQAVKKRAEIAASCPGVEWHMVAKRGKVKTMADGLFKDLTLQFEPVKAEVLARVEHPFHVLKNLFGHRKTRYRGLAKKTIRLHSLFALANISLIGRSLLRTAGA